MALAGALLILAALTMLVCLWPYYRQLATPCPNLGPCFGSSLTEAVGTVRQLVHQLRPPLLDQLGLLGAVRECALRVERGAQLRICLDLPESLPPLNAAIEAAAYYIVAEALTNVARRARAQRSVVRLRAGSELQVEVADSGVGPSAGGLTGVGLRSMRERAQELGGSWQMTGAAGGGTVVRACLPLTQKGG